MSSVRAMLVFDVVYRWDSWVGLLVALPLWKLAWHLHTMKASPGTAATTLCLSLSLCALSGQFIVSSAVGTYLPPLGVTKGKSNRLYALGSL